MTSTQQQNRSAVQHALSTMQRKPRRITITLNQATYDYLLERCNLEGRSLSNLCAFMLETTVQASLQPAVSARGAAGGLHLGPLARQ